MRILVPTVLMLGLTAVFGALPSRAEPAMEAPSIRLTLDEALERARGRSPRLGQLRALETWAEAGARGARVQRLPQIDLAAGYMRASNVPELTLFAPGQPSRTIFPNLPDNYRARLEASVPLYTGGRIEGGIVAAEQEKAAATREVQAGTADLILETTAAYWSLVTARENERVLREAIATYDSHLKSAHDSEAVGMAARNEVLTVQVERDRAELARLQAKSAAEVANANLGRLLGISVGTQVEPAEPLDPPPIPAEDSVSLVAEALTARPERAALEARVAAAEARVRAQRAGRRPQATFSAGYDYANPNRRILPPEDEFRRSWDASVNLSFSLFDGGRTAAAVDGAAALAEAERRQLEELDDGIRLEVTSRLLDLQTARAAQEVSERNLEAAEENRRVSRDRYAAGVIASSDLLDAETALLRAGLDRTESLARIRLAQASLQRAVGR